MMGQAVGTRKVKGTKNERMNVTGQGVGIWDCEMKAQAMMMRVNDEGMKAGWATLGEINQNVGKQDWSRKGRVKRYNKLAKDDCGKVRKGGVVRN